MPLVLIAHEDGKKTSQLHRLVMGASRELGQCTGVRIARCCAEATELLNSREQFGLIIVSGDMVMLDSDDSLVATLARQRQPRAFIILVSYTHEPAAHGADEFVREPVYREEFEALGGMIKDALRPIPSEGPDIRPPSTQKLRSNPW